MRLHYVLLSRCFLLETAFLVNLFLVFRQYIQAYLNVFDEILYVRGIVYKLRTETITK